MKEYNDAITLIRDGLSPICSFLDIIPPRSNAGTVYVVFTPKKGTIAKLYRYFKDKPGFKKWKFNSVQFKTMVYGTHVVFKIKNSKEREKLK